MVIDILVNAGRDWAQEEKGTTEDEMAGWHHGLEGRVKSITEIYSVNTEFRIRTYGSQRQNALSV